MLTKLTDLIGTTPVRADLRSRKSDGELMYALTQQEPPRVTTLRKVEVQRKKDKHGEWQNWLYWYWDKLYTIPNTIDCGYSGVLMDGEHEEQFYIDVYEGVEV